MLHGEVFDRFRVVGRLARGGMGELFLAEDEGVDVVVKTVRDDLSEDDEVRRSFFREMEITSRLHHDHLVRHVQHGTWRGVDVLVVERIHGISLSELLSHAPLPLTAALHVAEDIARGLAHVHMITDDEGVPLDIVHGDVSPQNILIDRAGDAHLIDFGAAHMRAMPVTRGTIIGKPSYLAPEQAAGLPVDARCDQYALGIVLWEMLAGERLFARHGMERDVAVPPPSTFCWLPPAIEAAVLRMLAPDPGLRFANIESVAELITALRFVNEIGDGRCWLADRVRAWERSDGCRLDDDRTLGMRRAA